MRFLGIWGKLRAVVPATMLTIALPAATDAQEAIRIGTAGPLSGAQAYFGGTWHNGIKMYIDELNAAGGIAGRPVELVQSDDKADPREGTLVAQKFCDDEEMLAVIAHFNSGVTLPSLDVYDACGMPQVTISSSPKITQLGFTHVFRVSLTDDVYGSLPARVAVNNIGAKSAIVMHDKQAFGQGIAEIFADQFEKAGGKVLAVLTVNPADVDFSPIVARIKKENPDVIYFSGVMPQLALLVKQMREQGVDAAYMTPDGAYTPDFVKQAGDAAEGTFVTFDAPPYEHSPKLKEFAAAYEAKYGEGPGAYSAYGYQQAWVLTEAIKAAVATDDLNRERIIELLRRTDLKDGVLGDVRFDENGDMPDAGVFIYKINNGEFDIFYSPVG